MSKLHKFKNNVKASSTRLKEQKLQSIQPQTGPKKLLDKSPGKTLATQKETADRLTKKIARAEILKISQATLAKKIDQLKVDDKLLFPLRLNGTTFGIQVVRGAKNQWKTTVKIRDKKLIQFIATKKQLVNDLNSGLLKKRILNRYAEEFKQQAVDLKRTIRLLERKKTLKGPEKKRYQERLQKQLSLMKMMPLHQLQGWAYGKTLDGKKKGKERGFKAMMEQFLSLEKKLPPTFLVDLKGENKFEVGIGLGHILPPSMMQVKIIDRRGNVRTGRRMIRAGRLGYFDTKGYIPIFSGYKVMVINSINEGSKEYKLKFQQESDHYRQMLADKTRWQAKSLDEVITKNPAKKKEWDLMAKIMKSAGLKLHQAAAFFGGNDFLRMPQGQALNYLRDSNTLKLVRALAHGKKFNGIQFTGGYQLKFGELKSLFTLANNGQQLNKILRKLYFGQRKFSANNIFNEYLSAQGAMALSQIRDLGSKFPHLMARVAENGLPFLTPYDLIYRVYRHKSALAPDKSALLNSIQRAPHLRSRLPNFWCARYVSMLLGIQPMEASSGALFSRLMKGGGKLVGDLRNSQVGDVFFMRGTYRQNYATGRKYNWHRPSHAAVVVRRNGNMVTIRHQSGGVIKEHRFNAQRNGYWQRRFYASVRLA